MDINQRLEGDRLADDHSEGRQEHACYPDVHHRCDLRHLHDEKIHVFDVPAVEFVIYHTDAQEEQGLCHCVKDNEKERRPGRIECPDPGTHDDQRQCGDCGVREYAL